MIRKAFTLIELLIVVAIIAILAAIAVPNFLEAQTRSKISRIKSDQRSLATAVEAYFVDENAYPVEHDPNEQLITLSAGGQRCGDGTPATADWLPCEFANITLVRLTTPIAYITSIEAARDPFVIPTTSKYDNLDDAIPFPYQFYVNFRTRNQWLVAVNPGQPDISNRAYGFQSLGPDNVDNGITNGFFRYFTDPTTLDDFVNSVYDPTNGTISRGDITRFGGEIPGAVQSSLSTTK